MATRHLENKRRLHAGLGAAGRGRAGRRGGGARRALRPGRGVARRASAERDARRRGDRRDGLGAAARRHARPRAARPDRRRRRAIRAATTWRRSATTAAPSAATGSASRRPGAPVFLRYGEVHEVRDGRIVQSSCLWDILDLIRQAGLLAAGAEPRRRGHVAGPDHRRRAACSTRPTRRSRRRASRRRWRCMARSATSATGRRRPRGAARHAAARALASADDVVRAGRDRHGARPGRLRRPPPAAVPHRLPEPQGRPALHPHRRRAVLGDRRLAERHRHPPRRRLPRPRPDRAAGRRCG